MKSSATAKESKEVRLPKTVKSDFPIFQSHPGLVYLDTAASAQKPRAVIDAEKAFYEHDYANVHRGFYPLAERATALYETARAKVADFVGAEADEIVFTRGATEALNLLAGSLTKNLGKGDVVLLTEMEHHANLVPWQEASKQRGFSLRFIPVLTSGKLDLTNLPNLLDGVKIVALTAASNVLGTINPVAAIAGQAHRAGAIVVVDAAQSLPHGLPKNVKTSGADFMAFSGHKLYGPTGIGVLYGAGNLLDSLAPYQTGGEMVEAVTYQAASWKEAPWKFEAGTPNIAGAIGLAAATDWLKTFDQEETERNLQALKDRLVSELKKIDAEILGPHGDQETLPLVSFNLAVMHAHDVAALLAERDIAVRASHHCAMPLHAKLDLAATVRVSLGLYNDESDVDKLISTLEVTAAKAGKLI